MSEKPGKMEWQKMLRDLVNVPGSLDPAFNTFRNYSATNRFMAILECSARRIPVGPMGPRGLWEKRFGRTIKPEYEGKGLTCWMPLPRREKNPTTGKWETVPGARPIFILKPYWYVLAMTEGPEMPPLVTPEWDGTLALATCKVEREDFAMLDGNCHGYAYEHTVAVSPVASRPVPTLIHEMAHVLLEHTTEHGKLEDGDTLTHGEVEAEAEAVSYIVSATLGLDGLADSRGYVQHWLKGPIRPKLAKRIMKTAAKILDAGFPPEPTK